MYSGNIIGIGPRYCPSIEDKVNKFEDKKSHQIFIEPEGINKDLVYPNGISTSLPHKAQEEFIYSIKGLERSVIKEYGYAVEYDFVDPMSLKNSLETKFFKNFYLAGQSSFRYTVHVRKPTILKIGMLMHVFLLLICMSPRKNYSTNSFTLHNVILL